RVNTFTSIFLTKLDILSAFDTIKVANAYTSGGVRYDEFPTQQSVLYHCEPEYEELPGWKTDISGVRAFGDLPPEAQSYVTYVAEKVGVPIGWVSVGPERSQLITLT
ncbi:MAG: adenylosuccinate synthetase, partial [Acidimicrobiia bacterium]|nr:adenylosuccinate synthetase [Acidimicrobiia bacterium]